MELPKYKIALIVGAGEWPWIALVLACSFGLYGLLRQDRWTERGGSIEQWLAEAARQT